VLKEKLEIWARIDKGWKIYEPLPQTAEEEVLWKQFVKDWEAWKASDVKVTEIISALAGNKSEGEQKQLFVNFYKQLEENTPLFKKAEDGLHKLVELNIGLADKTRLRTWQRFGLSCWLFPWSG